MIFFILLYGIVTVLWFWACVGIWCEGRKDGSSPEDQQWFARMALLAPVWLLVVLRYSGQLWMRPLGKRTGEFGRGIGEFMVDATKRKNDDE